MAEEKIVNAAPEEEQVQDVNELRQIRVEKLEALQAAGKDPFQITTAEQSIHNAEIVERFEELENTEVLRSDFINNFSHEFKTPIVSIAGFAKLLKKGNLSEKEKAEYIDIIEKESLRLSYLATNVFNLTKIENQTILTEINEYNPAEQIRHCVLLLENKWSEKEIDFNIELEDILISANEELMDQVWINLLDNAIKFSESKSTIDIKMKKEKTSTSFTITNKGVTISKDNIDRIFRKFYQADESHAAEGNGVGLAIVKKIIELHKGKITVESENGVTSFTVII
jgi:signal transduction histidine kinase